MRNNEGATLVPPDVTFTEGHIEADGFNIRYLSAGQGDPLVGLHGAGGLRLGRAHALLAERYQVILFEAPGFGQAPVNERSQSMSDLAATMLQAVTHLGIEPFNLMGNSFGGKLALCMALQQPERIQALVLVAPAAMRPEGGTLPRPTSPEERMALLYAHPERQPTATPPDPAIIAKQQTLVRRLMGPPRDEALESRLLDLHVPVLVLFGTLDRMIPSEMGRLYCEKLPNCTLVLVYDAGHAVDADRPEAFVSVTNDFLQHHEGFLVNRQSRLINP
ncbi:MAG: alpha/beta hydrolase [Candidatus Tectomicrobia bacterium]|nr:alpha/beta hydrolase [Candidatus Tectomicrobia bacterium]